MTNLLSIVIVISVLGIGCSSKYLSLNALLSSTLILTGSKGVLSLMAICAIIVIYFGSIIVLKPQRDRPDQFDAQSDPSGRRYLIAARGLAIFLIGVMSLCLPLATHISAALAMIISGLSCTLLDAVEKHLTGIVCALGGLLTLSALVASPAALIVTTALWVGAGFIGHRALPKMRKLLREADTRD